MKRYKRLSVNLWRVQLARQDWRTGQEVWRSPDLYLSKDKDGRWWTSASASLLAQLGTKATNDIQPNLEWGLKPMAAADSDGFEQQFGVRLSQLPIGEETNHLPEAP